jgi:hypothetical protein
MTSEMSIGKKYLKEIVQITMRIVDPAVFFAAVYVNVQLIKNNKGKHSIFFHSYTI